jgi:4-hydroxy-3-polyprenylbenzoate decarboxylase
VITQPNQPDRLIVGVTGATGIVYGARALDILRSVGIETHLIVTRAAGLTRAYETDLSRHDLDSRADYVYNINDVGAPMSSGSFLTRGMLIAPASMRTVGEIASGVTSSLLSRAADVVLKERRRLVLMVRETPFNLIHLRNMATITEAGGTIFAPVPAFYYRPTTIEEIIDHSVGRALDQFGIHTDVFPRWDDDLRQAVAQQETDD